MISSIYQITSLFNKQQNTFENPYKYIQKTSDLKQEAYILMKKLIINENNLPKLKKQKSQQGMSSTNNTNNIRIRLKCPTSSLPLSQQNVHLSQMLTSLKRTLLTIQKTVDQSVLSILSACNKQTKQVDTELLSQLSRQLKVAKIQIGTFNNCQFSDLSTVKEVDMMSQSMKFNRVRHKLANKDQMTSTGFCKQNLHINLAQSQDKRSVMSENIQSLQKDNQILSAESRVFEELSNRQNKQEQIQKPKSHTVHRKLSKYAKSKTACCQSKNNDSQPIIGKFQMLQNASKKQNEDKQSICLLKEQILVQRLKIESIQRILSEKQQQNKSLLQEVSALRQLNQKKVRSSTYEQFYRQQAQILSQQNQQKTSALRNQLNNLQNQLLISDEQIKSLQKQCCKLKKQKQNSVQKELSRYETAQHFYQLTRQDLSTQNDFLMERLAQIQEELRGVYLVSHQEHKCRPELQQNMTMENCKVKDIQIY